MLPFPLKICILRIYSELSVECAHAHAGHTHAVINNLADSGLRRF